MIIILCTKAIILYMFRVRKRRTHKDTSIEKDEERQRAFKKENITVAYTYRLYTCTREQKEDAKENDN